MLLQLLLFRGVLPWLLLLASSLKSSTVSSKIFNVDRISSLCVSPSQTTYRSSKVLHAQQAASLLATSSTGRSPGGQAPWSTAVCDTHLARLLCRRSQASCWY